LNTRDGRRTRDTTRAKPKKTARLREEKRQKARQKALAERQYRALRWQSSPLKRMLANHPVALQIAESWVSKGKGADPYKIYLWLTWALQGTQERRQALLLSQLRKIATPVMSHLSEARALLLRLPRLPFETEAITKDKMERFCNDIEEVVAYIRFGELVPTRVPRGRLTERHLTELFVALSTHLETQTGTPRWGELAKFVNDLHLRPTPLTRKQLEDRCLWARKPRGKRKAKPTT